MFRRKKSADLHDVRLATAHQLLAEAREHVREIPYLDESLIASEGNFIKERDAEPYEPKKYPRYVNFSLYRSEGEGMHGEIALLPNGDPGKATIDTWHKHAHYHIKAKLYDGVLRVSTIDYSLLPDLTKKRLYQA